MKRTSKVLLPKELEAPDLISIIGEERLDRLSRDLNADRCVTKLTASSVFKLLIHSILSEERISLRIMGENYSGVAFKAIAPETLGLHTAHSSIRDRPATIRPEFFEEIYGHVTGILAGHYGQRQLGQYNIRRYDSTMISTFSHLLEGMKVGNTKNKKNQVKMTTELTNEFEVRMSFFSDQAHLGEDVALREVIRSATRNKDDIIVFDRGLKSRATFCELKKEKTLFVTRLHDKNRYKVIRPHQNPPEKPIDGLDFLGDSIVHLYGDGNREVREEFRAVQVQVKKNGKKIWFLTNILFLPAEQIAQIYRMRWEIEVFFRFAKQEMNLTHFVCNDANAIRVMMYSTLIASMLVLVYKKLNGIGSYKIAKKRFCRELESAFILELLKTPEGLAIYKKCLADQVRLARQMPPKKRKTKPDT